MEALPEDEVEDMILAKKLALETDYEQALSDLKHGRTIPSNNLRARLREKIVD